MKSLEKAQHYAADHTQLGPDPEEPTLRFRALMRSAVPAGTPARCPLEAALGADAPCAEGACPFYRVRGVAPACAVEAWSPTASQRRDVALWYRARRDAKAARARRPRRPSPPRETPGQAHARRARTCVDAHRRTVAALRELDDAVHRAERWCDGLALELDDAGRRADELRTRRRRRG